MSRILLTLGLVAMGIYGLMSVIIIGERNGWAELMKNLDKDRPGFFPNTDYPAREVFTGVAGLDAALWNLIRAFHPCVSGEAPTLSFMTAWFGGQIIPLHAVLMIEGIRSGNRGGVFA